MTLKITETFRLPFGRSFTRKTVLRPGHKEILHVANWDNDGRGEIQRKVHIRVLSPDAMEGQTLSSKRLPRLPGESEVTQPLPPVRYECVDVGRLIDKKWGGKARGKFGQEIDIEWEPTMPHRSRR